MKLIKISPNTEMAKNILNMISLLEERIKSQNPIKMTALIISDYYEISKELITAILLVDGYKTLSHKDLIEYIAQKYKEFSQFEISILHKLRVLRNRVAYEGFLIDHSYLDRNEIVFKSIIEKLKKFLKDKLS
ncbi:MAG: hypothetical protein ABIB79_00430 [archaeon]